MRDAAIPLIESESDEDPVALIGEDLATVVDEDFADDEMEAMLPPEIAAGLVPLVATRAEFAIGDGHRHNHVTIKSFHGNGRPLILEHRFVVEAECHGWRLDRFLMKRMRRLSRARVQRVIHGDLDVNGIATGRPAARVKSGDRVAFRRPAPVEPEVPRHAAVLHADPLFYALDKPAGLPIHPTARYHFATLTAVLRELFPDEKLEVCHRLDRETSGVLLVGRTREAGPRIKGSFARRLVKKSYLAIVHGELPEAIGSERRIDLPLGLCGGRVRIKMGVVPVDKGGLLAATVICPVRRYRGYTLVEARPETGRQHQIRAHLDAIGFPVVGDKLYPHEDRFVTWVEEGDSPELLAALTLPRHALHAARLEFPHPQSGAPVIVESPLAADLEQFLSTLELI